MTDVPEALFTDFRNNLYGLRVNEIEPCKEFKLRFYAFVSLLNAYGLF